MARQRLKAVVFVELYGALIQGVDDDGGGPNLLADERGSVQGIDKKITGVSAARIASIDGQLPEEYHWQGMVLPTWATEICRPVIRLDASA
ncbi:hypothetical protein LMH63_15135 [Spiribacter halobius]|nr:hypothetical protein [Spiribacter halobius]UEX77265.1 hypothetical protein LMH63_15135 [Spiribacter halobius]